MIKNHIKIKAQLACQTKYHRTFLKILLHHQHNNNSKNNYKHSIKLKFKILVWRNSLNRKTLKLILKKFCKSKKFYRKLTRISKFLQSITVLKHSDYILTRKTMSLNLITMKWYKTLFSIVKTGGILLESLKSALSS